MTGGARPDGERDAAIERIPVPVAQRIRGLIDDLKAIELLLSEVSFDDYKGALHSGDSIKLVRTAYPLERAFEIASNYLLELVGLALKELGIASVDGPTDVQRSADEKILTQRMADQLADIHRARNALQHDYPDLRASTIYPACQELAKITPAFLRAYVRWLRSVGYGKGAT
jgi:uncharacterized protein YutE (UPF0331/DUF86 family)